MSLTRQIKKPYGIVQNEGMKMRNIYFVAVHDGFFLIADSKEEMLDLKKKYSDVYFRGFKNRGAAERFVSTMAKNRYTGYHIDE